MGSKLGAIIGAFIVALSAFAAPMAALQSPSTPGVSAASGVFADGFEEPALDPFWTSDGSEAPTGAVFHSGNQSLQKNWPGNTQHDFGSPQTGVVSVWWHGAQLCCGAAADVELIGENGWASVVQGGGQFGFRSSSESNPATSHNTVFGGSYSEWHQFELRVDATGATAKFDGVVVGSDPSVTSFHLVNLSVWGGGPGAIAVFYDDFSIETAPVQPTSPGTFAPTGTMHFPRANFQATRLMDGRVLASGGNGVETAESIAPAEIYDPATGTWVVTGSNATARQEHAATLLLNGHVLVVGGVGHYYSCSSDASAETYDPATGQWSPTGGLPITVGTGTIAVTLTDGRVLVTGGGNRCGGVFNSAALYDPATNTWSTTASMSVAREFHSAVALGDGRVLVAGGANGSGFVFETSSEIFDPATETWSAAGTMASGHGTGCGNYVQPYLARTGPGQVIAAGGYAGSCYGASVNGATDVFDSSTALWTPAAPMITARATTTTTALTSGLVLVAGGFDSAFNALATAEVFDPQTGNWTNTGSLSGSRTNHTATLLLDGRVLIAGGASTPPGSSELYVPGLEADTEPPAVACAPPDSLWHGGNVTVACTASDGGSGLANPADAAFDLTTQVPDGAEDPNATTDMRTVCDNAGNCAEAGPIAGHKIDRKPPTVSIVSPTSTAIVVGQTVLSSYACADSGAGMATCSAPVADGAAIDTSTVGPHTFTVTGTDAVGNAASSSITYTVTAVPVVVSIALNPGVVQGGAVDATATLTLNGQASGTVAQRRVALSSSNTAAATVPAAVTVPLGATTVSVTVHTLALESMTTVTMSTTQNGWSATSEPLTVVPLPKLAALAIASPTVYGDAQTATGTVTLDAPAVGTTAQRRVILSSGNAAVATVPTGVTVPVGATSASFNVATQTVESTTSVQVSGALNGGAASADLVVLPLPRVIGLTLVPETVAGAAQHATATVTLDAPAIGSAAQRRVTLTSSNPAAATAPSTVTLPIGASSATFTVTSHAVAATASATVSAVLNGGSASATLTVQPLPVVTSLSLNPGDVVGGATDAEATVTLSAPAVGSTAQRRVSLSSGNTAAATVPATVVVPAGATTATFVVSSKVVSTPTGAVIAASLNGGSASATLTVSPLLVEDITVSPISIQGGVANAIATVALNAPAAGTIAQRRVLLSSDNPATASVPGSVVVPVGATSVTFTVTSHAVASPTIAVLGASLNGVTKTTPISVVP